MRRSGLLTGSEAAAFFSHFSPGYFSLVMATGVVSIACHLAGLETLGLMLFALNIVQYGCCVCAMLYRLFAWPGSLWRDLVHHQQGPAFLTIVAATNILSSQFSLLTSHVFLPKLLWLCGVLFWLLLMYLMLAGVTVAKYKPTLEQGLNGNWLLCTVASASVAVAGSFCAAHFARTESILFFCLLAYMSGIMLYIVIISQIFYRWIFLEMEPQAFSPSYWINMGALAISTLAGARLLIAGQSDPLILSMQPFLLGLTLFVGAFACWWIPFLLILFLYRRLAYGVRITYDIQNWAVVFPIGMFCVAWFNFLPLLHQSWLLPLIHAFVLVALLAWSFTFAGLLRRVFSKF